MNNSPKPKIIVAVTGASGMLFLTALLRVLKDETVEIHGVCSSSGAKVLQLEEGLSTSDLPTVSRWFDEKDFTAPPASGSSCYRGMVILPCTMGTLAAVANGFSMNLIHRAADVMLKEKRKLLLAVRETPLNRNHLENMLKVHDAGGVIMPPMPAYYFKPANLDEAAETFAWRVAAKLGFTIDAAKHWGEETEDV